MRYLVYGTTKDQKTEPDYRTLVPFVDDTLALAVERAFKLIEIGLIVWRIEGPDKLVMDREKIEKEYFSKTGKQAGGKDLAL